MSTPVAETEVVDDLPKSAIPVSPLAKGPPAMNMSWGTTIRSPLFWLFLGAIGVIGYYEWCRYNDNKKKKGFL